jgi:hypothetical protein
LFEISAQIIIQKCLLLFPSFLVFIAPDISQRFRNNYLYGYKDLFCQKNFSLFMSLCHKSRILFIHIWNCALLQVLERSFFLLLIFTYVCIWNNFIFLHLPLIYQRRTYRYTRYIAFNNRWAGSHKYFRVITCLPWI